ncbi:helix-turn-helix transcriptional regulator [Haloferax volcanii]|uniref:MarR family transcriptional regulator n=2 Tax=Haloferax volcanii TaxID=2246 RepID=L9UK82_HALVD|nr:hypothetical protein [Haloferax volcanii]ELY25152.1 hypothetical protein C498_17293 [Haloferax volcanii DS2]MBS8121206.1 hypothetical protein [Haloferax volcanii]MBS8126215.1 hypothetical protein [Haloferax volcanii]MBS8130085.1 hypothetical protein [Haloferax volcanii]MBS8133950.1 hypothetical protein [Haloferax volcanii]
MSDNSDPRSVEGAEIVTEHDTRSRRIVRHARENGGTTTRRDLVAKTDLTASELGERLQTLEDGGYVDQISDGDHELVVLTFRGEHLAGGYR